MATTQSDMILRLRRLIDDVGHAYSQSAPGFSTDLSALTAPAIGIFMDDDATQTDVSLGAPAGLTTGPAIAAALQRGLRASNPMNQSYTNAVVTFHRADGYIVRSGTYGSHSQVSIVSPLSGDDATEDLKIGLANGGYESEAQLDFSDEDLGLFLDDALSIQNNSGEITSWDYDTLPSEYQTVIAYRSWGTVIDTRLGRSANYYPQKVASEETSANVIFDNYLKLAKWLRDTLDDMLNGLESQVETYTVIRWDRELQRYVGDESYFQPVARVNTVLPGITLGDAILEFEPVLTLDCKHVFIAYSDQAGVWDPTALTEEDYTDPGRTTVAGLASHATLERELKSMKYPLVKITGLTPGQTYYFAIQVTDQNGNRYFSNEVSLTVDLPD